MSGDRRFGETVWVNPQKRWLSADSRGQSEAQQSKEVCPELIFMGERSQEEVRLMPDDFGEWRSNYLKLKLGLVLVKRWGV